MSKYPQLVHRSLWAAIGAAVLFAGGGGCKALPPTGGNPPDGGPGTMPRLVSVPETVEIKPGQSAELGFRLVTSAGMPIAGQEVRFSITDDPETTDDDAQGATLAVDRHVTGADGIAEVKVTAGLEAIFRVRAQARGARDADAVVFVGSGEYGGAEVSAAFTAGALAAASVVTVDVYFYDGQACAGLSLGRPVPPVRGIKTMAVDGVAHFASINAAANHAIIGRGRDAAGAVKAAGCVDLPGATLLTGRAVRVPVPLFDQRPSPLGSYSVQSRFVFDKPPKPVEGVPTPWSDLADCPLDPAQLWIDCTLDALSGDDAADPLDCAPMDEGVLGLRLASRRGGVGLGGCRPPVDAAGRATTDALVAGLFPSSRPPLLASLALLGPEAAVLLATIRLESVLTLSATSIPGRHQADHVFRVVELALAGGPPARVDLALLGVPVPAARSFAAVEQGGELGVGPHGITLRLGSAARVGFGELALGRRGLPRSSAAFVDALAALAARVAPGGGEERGCLAFDGVLCREMGEPEGCVVKACGQGLTALAKRLDSGFLALDGDDLDLMLDGSAVIVDGDADGAAERLGDTSRPGLWAARLRVYAGSAMFSGVWSATRRP